MFNYYVGNFQFCEENLPFAQGTQKADPLLEPCELTVPRPTGHLMQNIWFVSAANMPGLQSPQKIWPRIATDLPGMHGRHRLCPLVGWYIPLEHSRHAVAPEEETLPGLQG